MYRLWEDWTEALHYHFFWLGIFVRALAHQQRIQWIYCWDARILQIGVHVSQKYVRSLEFPIALHVLICVALASRNVQCSYYRNTWVCCPALQHTWGVRFYLNLLGPLMGHRLFPDLPILLYVVRSA